jgi:ribose-phosphate pyrophosphokinase
MMLFVFPAYAGMGNGLATALGIRLGQCSIERFPNQELHAAIQTDVVNEKCIILSTIAPPDEQLLSTLLLSHTLKKEGARTISALLPYLAYARDDKRKAGQSVATAWVGALLQDSGVDEVITVDVHSSTAQRLFPIPVVSLSPAELFAQEIKRLALLNATIVAPDEGARDRCQTVASAAGMAEEVVVLEKRRTREGVTHVNISGHVGQQAVIVDDILDTGGTLVSCCEQLQQRGVRDITILVAHGLFTGMLWQKLWTCAVKRIYCSDTIPSAKERPSENIGTLSVLPLLAQCLQARLVSSACADGDKHDVPSAKKEMER